MWKPEQDQDTQAWGIVDADGNKLTNTTGSRVLAFTHRIDAEQVAKAQNEKDEAKARAEKCAAEPVPAPSPKQPKKK